MEWEHKGVKITVDYDGRFCFNQNDVAYHEYSLNDARHKIDQLTEEYYNFTEKDKERMLKKLDRRERDFVTQLMEELKRHSFNAYCEIGISDEMFFSF